VSARPIEPSAAFAGAARAGARCGDLFLSAQDRLGATAGCRRDRLLTLQLLEQHPNRLICARSGAGRAELSDDQPLSFSASSAPYSGDLRLLWNLPPLLEIEFVHPTGFGAGATGLEPATSGVTGVSKVFQPVSRSRRIGEVKPFSAGSQACVFRLIAPGRFHLVSTSAGRPGAPSVGRRRRSTLSEPVSSLWSAEVRPAANRVVWMGNRVCAPHAPQRPGNQWRPPPRPSRSEIVSSTKGFLPVYLPVARRISRPINQSSGRSSRPRQPFAPTTGGNGVPWTDTPTTGVVPFG
jgi:hypothetical protein